MTDRDHLVAMLKAATTEWTQYSNNEKYECKWKSDSNKFIAIEITKNFINVHSGYAGYVSEFAFPDEGKLIFLGAFE